MNNQEQKKFLTEDNTIDDVVFSLFGKTLYKNQNGSNVHLGHYLLCDDGSLVEQNDDLTAVMLLDAPEKLESSNIKVTQDEETLDVWVKIGKGEQEGYTYNLNNDFQRKNYALNMGLSGDAFENKSISDFFKGVLNRVLNRRKGVVYD